MGNKGRSKFLEKTWKSAKPKDTDVHQLEQFGWVCAVDYNVDITKSPISLNRWQWIRPR